MIHGSPRFIRIRSEFRCSILSNLKARSSSGYRKVDNRGLVGHGFDCVGIALGIKLHCYVVGIEVVLVFAEIDVV